MPSTEELQTRMMARMLREKAKKHGSVRKMLEKEEETKKIDNQQKSIIDQRHTQIFKNLQILLSSDQKTDPELVGAMKLLIPLILQMYLKSTNWLIRDRALGCLQEISRKMGKSIIDEFLGRVPEGKRMILEKFLI